MGALAVCLDWGRGTRQNRQAARLLYEDAASAGDEFAIAKCWERGWGVRASSAKAVEHYIKAAEAGDARAMYTVGRCYDGGSDKTRAVKWFGRAAVAGNLRAAAWSYADSAMHGTGMPRNMEVGLEWSERAIRAGFHEYLIVLGDLFYEGVSARGLKITTADPRRAFHYCRRAARMNHPEGMSRYGNCLLKGIGVERDEKEGMRWIYKSAEANFVMAMVQVGQANMGAGPSRDLAKAADWFRRARRLDPRDATPLLRQLLRQFPTLRKPGDPE